MQKSEAADVDVVVIGAGAAGLSAAKVLTARGYSVQVLEAGPKVGGRVLSDTTLAGWPLELGPEFLHGEKNNRLLDLVEAGIKHKPDASLVELEWPNYYYFGKEGTLLSAEEADEQEDVAHMHETFERLGEMQAPPSSQSSDASAATDTTLLQYFATNGLSSRVLDLADAIFANDYGADMSDVGLHEVVHEQRHWAYGEKYLVLRGACLQDAMETLASGLNVCTNWRAESVHRGDLAFAPPLPAQHASAIGKLRMGSAVKVIVKLSKRFWPLDFFDAVCADCFLPEVWLSPAAELMRPDCPGPYTIVGFVAGARAERVAKLPHAEAARLMLAQLDAMFGTTEVPHPASDCCAGYLVKDWGSQPFVHGAYSHPTRGAHGQRPALAEPAHGSIFFAGEACHSGVNPCLHGAMETGEEAAERCTTALQREPSSARRSRL